MKIAVTGASGHIGCNLIRQLVEEGEHRVRVLQYEDNRALERFPVEIVEGSILQPEVMDKFTKGMDAVIHLAAMIAIDHTAYDAVYRVNFTGTQNLLNAARKNGVRRFVHFSSIHVLDHRPLDEVMDESRPLLLDASLPYEKTKALADQWVLEQQSDDFDVLVLNPTSVIGPCDFKPSLMGQMLLSLYHHQIPALIPGGYDWVDARDVARSAAAAVTKGRGGERYILSGRWTTVRELAALMEKATGRRIPVTLIPVWVAKAGLPFIWLWSKITGSKPLYTSESIRILQTNNRRISSRKAAEELGHRARPLEETLRDSIDWFKQNNYL